MKIIGGVNLSGSVNRADGNLLFPVIHKGDIFPVTPVAGQLFYRTDIGAAYIFNGTSWEGAGGGDVSNPITDNLDAAGYSIGNLLAIEAQYLIPPFATPTPSCLWEIAEIDIGGDKYPSLIGHNSSPTWGEIGIIQKALIIYNESPTDAATILFANSSGIGSVFTMDLASSPPRCRILGTFGINTVSGGFGKALELDNSLFAGSGDPGDGVRISFRAKHQGGGLGTGFDTGYIDVVMTDSTELGYKTEMSFYTCDTGSSASKKINIDESGVSINKPTYPAVNSTYSLGKSDYRWSTVYSNSINIGTPTNNSTISYVDGTSNTLVTNSNLTSNGNIWLTSSGTNTDSYKIFLQALTGVATVDVGSIQLIHGADPYIKIMAPNDSGVELDAMHIHDDIITTSSDMQISSTNAFYFGDKNTDGTWRIVRSGNNLVFERRESGSYVAKQTMTP